MKTIAYNSSITRGLGGMFVFAALQMLEYNEYLLAAILLAVGGANLGSVMWSKKWTSLIVLGLNTGISAIVFYQFILMETQFLPWIWLVLLIYYVYRLRELGKASAKVDEIKRSQEVPQA